MRTKVSIIGHFGHGKNLLNGQTIKTRILTDELQRQFGEDQILKIDTYGGKKVLLKAPFQVLSALKNTSDIVVVPCINGTVVYTPLLVTLRCLFRNRRLHYVAIGAWQPRFLLKHKILAKLLMKFDAIYVETNTTKAGLNEQGFSNVFVMTNCKQLDIVSKEELIYPSGKPYKLCTFSRVMKEKGMETAINAIKRVNEKIGHIAYTLDIYGQVDAGQKEWFENLQRDFPEYVRYCGYVEANQSVEVLRPYFALLFPTHYFAEGVPGTIIDAYAAGVPVISAKWQSYADVVDDGITGVGYDFDDEAQFEEILSRAVQNPESLLKLKENCILKARDYIPETVIQIMTEKFGKT